MPVEERSGEQLMRALRFARFGSPDVLELVERPIPQATDDEVVVRVDAAAVQPSDIKGVAGMMEGTVLPRTPGRDFTSVVVEGPRELLGRAVWGTAGDLGFTRDGTHAEYVRFPAAGLGPRPATLSVEQAAAVPLTFITAWIGLINAAQLHEGESVVVFGASGGVGGAVTQLAHWRGARVIGADYVLQRTISVRRRAPTYSSPQLDPSWWKPCAPRIAARFPLARAREAYEVVERGDARGRVVLVPR